MSDEKINNPGDEVALGKDNQNELMRYLEHLESFRTLDHDVEDVASWIEQIVRMMWCEVHHPKSMGLDSFQNYTRGLEAVLIKIKKDGL